MTLIDKPFITTLLICKIEADFQNDKAKIRPIVLHHNKGQIIAKSIFLVKPIKTNSAVPAKEFK
jgi:hypothetical protein